MLSARRLLQTMIALGAMWLCLSTRGFGDVEGEAVSTSGGESADWTKRRYPSENLGAYRPLRRPTIPTNEVVTNPTELASVTPRLPHYAESHV